MGFGVGLGEKPGAESFFGEVCVDMCLGVKLVGVDGDRFLGRRVVGG